jgi:hypothetical protein
LTRAGAGHVGPLPGSNRKAGDRDCRVGRCDGWYCRRVVPSAQARAGFARRSPGAGDLVHFSG